MTKACHYAFKMSHHIEHGLLIRISMQEIIFTFNHALENIMKKDTLIVSNLKLLS